MNLASIISYLTLVDNLLTVWSKSVHKYILEKKSHNFTDIIDFCVYACIVREQLLKTADASTSDVSGLHAKLDRKRNVESHNASVQEKFRDSFHNGIDVLTSHVEHFVIQQEQFSSSLCNSFG